jgi:kynurenine 3-monooxygenase
VTASDHITLIGAGLAGTLMATLLARSGRRVTLYESRPDPRQVVWTAGRSINLALAARGLHALELAGIADAVRPLLIPMRGRMLHDLSGGTQLVPYGQRSEEVIYSVSRPGLNDLLIEHAERAGVEILFGQRCVDIDDQRVKFLNAADERVTELPLERVIAADGAGSIVRQTLTQVFNVTARSEMLDHGYKELTIRAQAGRHVFDQNALHVWPRGGFMLIALPNPDGSFTATLFLPLKGEDSFATLTDGAAVETFLTHHFADARAAIPDLAHDFFANPVGEMGTVYCDSWTFGGTTLLIGDAAHAIVPFHGQGMNCAFEDCIELHRLLSDNDWATACTAFSNTRRRQTDAIAAMALENYGEMRDTVRTPRFQLQKTLSLELERRFPTRFIPRYSMVMFHHEIPYADAFARGGIQSAILDHLTAGCDDLSNIDWEIARQLIETQLPPLD